MEGVLRNIIIVILIYSTIVFTSCNKNNESSQPEKKPTISIEGLTEDAALFVEDQMNRLKTIANEPIIHLAIQKSNEQNQDLTKDDIDMLDRNWQENNSMENPLIRKLLTNECAAILKKYQRKYPQFLEIFVMDNRGLIVGTSNITSDYLQADEAKWSEVFNTNQIWHSNIKYDESTATHGIQISVPVMDIGAICTTISLKNRFTVK